MERRMAVRTPSTFVVGADKYQVSSYAPAGAAAKTAAVVLLYGTDGLDGESGTEIPKLAAEIADAGFIVSVPEYFGGKEPGGLPLEELFIRRIQAVGTFAPRIAAAIEHARSDPRVDRSRLGLVGLSLGGGLALQYAVGAPAGTVDAVVDYFGYIDAASTVYRDAAKLPPTVIFHCKHDKIVDPSFSLKLRDELRRHGIVHDCQVYDDDYSERKFHPFRPGGDADKDARRRAIAWLKKHVTTAV
jgi:dienelactone hydrolase